MNTTKQVNWNDYKEWYQDETWVTGLMLDETLPVVILDVDDNPYDEKYYLVEQGNVSSWIPARFVIESEVES